MRVVEGVAVDSLARARAWGTVGGGGLESLFGRSKRFLEGLKFGCVC